ncbi:hypothetical protein IMSAGC009_00929 [Lachnospiraceae bacterium]|nr:hypothetical protein IMSAGC009_00929 [Lachnospiraceae bacterium]
MNPIQMKKNPEMNLKKKNSAGRFRLPGRVMGRMGWNTKGFMSGVQGN